MLFELHQNCGYSSTYKVCNTMWLPWQRFVRQTRKSSLAYLQLKVIMCTRFHLNRMKIVAVFPPTRFWQKCGCHGNAFFDNSKDTSYTVVVCDKFHLNWMKSVEVLPPTIFCTGPTNQPSNRALTPFHIPKYTSSSSSSFFVGGGGGYENKQFVTKKNTCQSLYHVHIFI